MYFEKSECYPLSVYEGEDAFILVHKYADTMMYVNLYYT